MLTMLKFLWLLLSKSFMPMFLTYNSLTDRTDATPLIPEEVTAEIFQGVTQNSAFLSKFRQLPQMSRKQLRMPVLSFLPTAYFRDGDTGLAQTTEQKWTNKYINAEEVVVIVPVPKTVLDDVDYDIWAEIKPQLIAAFGNTVDAAIGFGTNAPALWPDDILTAATAAGNVVALGTGVDLYDDLFNENGVVAAVEADGFLVNGHIGAMTMRAKLRGLRDADGIPIFTPNMKLANTYVLDGNVCDFPTNGGFDASKALLMSGDFNQAVYSLRKGIEFQIFTEAVIQDGSGAIVYNLAQQGMIAMQCSMRLGWNVPNPINRMQATEANRYPFGVLTP